MPQYKKHACQTVSALTGSVPRKMTRSCRRIQHSSGIEPISPDILQLTLTTKSLIRINCLKKTVYNSSYFATCNWFFGVQDCCTRNFHLEYQGQTRNTRTLERKPLIDTSYRIRYRLELKIYFTSHNFRSMLIEQLINLEKVRTDNLKFRTDLRDQCMDGWSVTQ